jgi:hypothetical protein
VFAALLVIFAVGVIIALIDNRKPKEHKEASGSSQS